MPDLKYLTYWLRVAGSALLIGWLAFALDWQDLWQRLSGVSIPLFLAALFLSALTTVFLRALFVWSLVEKDSRPGLASVVETFFSLRFFSIVLPRPVVIGLRIARLNSLFGRNVYFAIGLMSYEALTGLLAMSIGAVLFYFVEAGDIGWSPVYAYVFLTAAGLSLLFLVLFTTRLDILVRTLIGLPLMTRPLRIRLDISLDRWRSWVGQHIARDSSALWSTVVFALIFYLGFIVSGYVLFLSMGESLSFSALAWTRSAVWLITVLPISIGGLGVREAGFAFFLASYGVDFEVAVAYGLLAFVLQTAIGLIGAAIELKNSIRGR